MAAPEPVTPTTSAEIAASSAVTPATSPAVSPSARTSSSLPPADELLALLDGRRLSPAQRRIAHYLLENLPEVAFLSSMELAERVGVSQPSVTRFAAALGFSGYPELRAALRPIALRVPETGIHGERIAGNELHSALESDQANLEALHKYAADPARLARLGSDLAASEPLSVIGLRMSAPVASYFAYGAARIHPDVRVIDTPGSPADEALLQAVAAGGTWLVAFVLPRYPAESVVVLRTARELGLKTAVVTDVPLVPFAHLADVLLPVGVGSRSVFDSHAAPMAFAALLLQALADAAPERTQERLEAYETLAETRGFYVSK
ncbi:MurR/RpiR family transcriptional regulator [Catenulispora sp. MAP12-49]|uniref:MurR/RpiR family transcriptional regulator n=1 Tax=Catenulispora sp. MAP12-49 TaxID=3156302 RepID=UPI0035121ADB